MNTRTYRVVVPLALFGGIELAANKLEINRKTWKQANARRVRIRLK